MIYQKMIIELVLTMGMMGGGAAGSITDRIDICSQHPSYWQYQSKPILLIGGSSDDSLFQIPDLVNELDLLASVGGNYVRNTMSSRNDKGFEVQAFARRKDGTYDLNRWNPEYWRRFKHFLDQTEQRNIIVQIEIWATFDYYRDNWDVHPFNPKNNVNYTAQETGLPVQVNSHPTRTENNFFWSIPEERNQATVLKYQQRFVDKILSISLSHGNVLYCMDNETSVTPAWGRYWATYIHGKAKEAGVKVHTTEMWDAWDLSHKQHKATFEHPDIYSFVDISQNNHQKQQAHWDNAQKQRLRIKDHPRPLNNVKIYGADGGRFGNSRDGMERFWRNIFGGLSSARFHRPDSGLGLSQQAQANIKSMRMVTDRIDVFSCLPHNDLLSQRKANEAYCLAQPGHEYAVYFPKGGEVVLKLKDSIGAVEVTWLDIMASRWLDSQRLAPEKNLLTLTCPSQNQWSVIIKL